MRFIGRRAAILLIMAAAGVVALGENRPFTVVMMGDSTTLCADMAAGHKLTDYVQAGLMSNSPAELHVINAGKGRDTVHGGLARYPADVLPHHPDLVTLSFGLNDTVYLTPAQYRKGLEDLVNAIQQATTAAVVLVTSTPFVNAHHSVAPQFKDRGGLDEYLDANICSATREVARQFKLPLCDLHALFKVEFARDPDLADTLIQPDGVHLTEAGNRMAARFLGPVILSELAKVPATGLK